MLTPLQQKDLLLAKPLFLHPRPSQHIVGSKSSLEISPLESDYQQSFHPPSHLKRSSINIIHVELDRVWGRREKLTSINAITRGCEPIPTSHLPQNHYDPNPQPLPHYWWLPTTTITATYNNQLHHQVQPHPPQTTKPPYPSPLDHNIFKTVLEGSSGVLSTFRYVYWCFCWMGW